MLLFSCSLMSDSLWPHGLPNTRVPSLQVSSVQSLSPVWLFATPWTAEHQGSFSSVQFSHSVLSDSLQPHVLQQASLLCLSPTPGACSNSCPLSHWSHSTISSSVIPFSACSQSFSASGSFPISLVFISGGQYWSFSISLSNEYSGLISFRIDGFDLLAVQGTLKNLLQQHSSKASVLQCSASFMVQHSHPYMYYWKNHTSD